MGARRQHLREAPTCCSMQAVVANRRQCHTSPHTQNPKPLPALQSLRCLPPYLCPPPNYSAPPCSGL